MLKMKADDMVDSREQLDVSSIMRDTAWTFYKC
jgi:hypothetical protein